MMEHIHGVIGIQNISQIKKAMYNNIFKLIKVINGGME